jgi:hypothetical protein
MCIDLTELTIPISPFPADSKTVLQTHPAILFGNFESIKALLQVDQVPAQKKGKVCFTSLLSETRQ